MKLEQPALHRKRIKQGLMTEKESKRLVDEANVEDNLVDQEEDESRYPYGD